MSFAACRRPETPPRGPAPAPRQHRSQDGPRADWIVTTSPVYDSEGNLVAAMEMCLDITSRKDLELALRRSEKQYKDAGGDSVAAKNAEGGATFYIRLPVTREG